METDLHIETANTKGIPIIRLNGELDAYTCAQLREEMIEVIENSSPNIVVDMSDVEYIDSSGLGTLVGGLKRSSEKGGKIAVVCVAGQIRKVFEITGLEKVFPIFDDEAEALAAISA